MQQTRSTTSRAGTKRTEHPDAHYSVGELASFLGVTEKTVLQRVERLSRRTFTTKRGNTRKPTLWASVKGQLLNETAANRLMRLRRDNFRAIPTQVRPINTLSYKQVHALGIGNKQLFTLVQNDRIETHLYKGRYMFNADDIAVLTKNLPKAAPSNMIPLHRLKYARECSKQAIYAWADRNPGNQGVYRSNNSVACVRHVTVEAAYAYLTKALGSPAKALERIKRLGTKFYRQVKPAWLKIDLRLNPTPNLDVHSHPDFYPYASPFEPNVFHMQYGHDLILLAT